MLQSGQGEQCDNGGHNNDNSYGRRSCKTNCKLGGYCGDGMPNGKAKSATSASTTANLRHLFVRLRLQAGPALR